MTDTAAVEQTLEDRYGTGRKRNVDRRFAWIVVAALVIAGIVFLLFSGWNKGNEVGFQDIGFTQQGELSADVKFQVSAPPQSDVACALEALNTAKATVGWKIVELPRSDDRHRKITENIRMTTPATTAYARDCWIVK